MICIDAVTLDLKSAKGIEGKHRKKEKKCSTGELDGASAEAIYGRLQGEKKSQPGKNKKGKLHPPKVQLQTKTGGV